MRVEREGGVLTWLARLGNSTGGIAHDLLKQLFNLLVGLRVDRDLTDVEVICIAFNNSLMTRFEGTYALWHDL